MGKTQPNDGRRGRPAPLRYGDCITHPAARHFFARRTLSVFLGLNLREGWVWHIVAILVYPLAALLTLGLALALKAVSVDGFAAQGLGAYASVVGVMFVGSLMKNIFEEFAWRGHLTPRQDAAKVHPLLNRAIVSILWWLLRFNGSLGIKVVIRQM